MMTKMKRVDFSYQRWVMDQREKAKELLLFVVVSWVLSAFCVLHIPVTVKAVEKSFCPCASFYPSRRHTHMSREWNAPTTIHQVFLLLPFEPSAYKMLTCEWFQPRDWWHGLSLIIKSTHLEVRKATPEEDYKSLEKKLFFNFDLYCLQFERERALWWGEVDTYLMLV